jgi:hypothetical protein
MTMASLKPYQQHIVDLMVRQELLIAELYLIFAGRFPQLHDFWISLHREELEHAQWLEHLAAKVNNGALAFSENEARIFAVQGFVDFITDSIIRARTPRMTFDEALSLTLSMEESLLERKVFDHFDGDSPEIDATLSRLRTETGEHVSWMRTVCRQYRTA